MQLLVIVGSIKLRHALTHDRMHVSNTAACLMGLLDRLLVVTDAMCSYNSMNGVPTCGDPNLLNGILRDQWKQVRKAINVDCDS